GFEDDWNETDSKRLFATYTNLDSGSYTFRVLGSNNDGVWNEKGTSIRITVTPPFWQTWWAYIFYVLVILIFIFVFLRNQRNKLEKERNTVKILQEAKEQIKTNLKEKETLLQELYHRTKNNMQVIRSMLMLHAAKYSNEQIQELVQDTGNRIQTMSLVHQMLYQSKDLSNINVKDYVEGLSRQIFQSYQTSFQKISLVFEIEEISLLIDTAIPLGLVLNELISNSLKYGFPGERKGGITIKISRKNSEKINLYFSDDGVGVLDEFDFENQKTLGISMIKGIVEQQMDGVVKFEKTNGLICHIEISDTLYEARI
ncbi:histidine kinase, partial [bacterium]|nr:histidine kinase [bacterium]